MIKNLPVKLFSFFNGGYCIGDQERVVSNSSANLMEGVLVIKNLPVKLNGASIGDQNVSAQFYRFFNGGSIGDEERVWQTLQFLQWRQYW